MSISNKYEIERKYIREGNARSGQKLKDVRFIVSHETANSAADADNHFSHLNNNQPSASAHAFVDSGKILELIPLDEKAWHVQYQKSEDNRLFGDDANDAAIGVELCRPGSFKEAYDRYVWYHAYLCHKFGLDPRKKIIQHSKLDPQRRSDPESWLKPNGVTWGQFINDVVEYYENWNEVVNHVDHKEKVKSETVTIHIRKGDEGPKVKELQQKLISLGYKLTKYGADSDFGDETENAVKQFQHDQGIKDDGIVGPITESKLKNVKSIQEKDNAIPVLGYIQIVNVSNAAYICDRPSSTNSKNLDTAKKGSKWPISGSVPGWFEIIHKGRRAYVNEKYGKHV